MFVMLMEGNNNIFGIHTKQNIYEVDLYMQRGITATAVSPSPICGVFIPVVLFQPYNYLHFLLQT